MAIYEKSTAKDIIADPKRIEDITRDTLEKMAAVVGASLGPGGRPVAIERDGLSPLITKDGVTIARHLGVAKAEDNLIIESAKEICLNTAKEAGDGTTTAIVVANALVQTGTRFLSQNKKYNPQKLVSEIREAYNSVVVPYLKKYAIPAEEEDQLLNVATVSANGDREIAEVCVDAVMAAGDDGTVLIEENESRETKVETLDGMVITSGLKELGSIGPAFINDTAGQQVMMDKGIVFLYNGSMNDLKPLGTAQDFIQGSEHAGAPLIVFAHSFSDVVKDRIAKNVKGGNSIVLVKTPLSGMSNSRSILLADLAAYTGATVYDPGNLHDLTEEGFGTFETAKVTMFETFMVGSPDPDLIETRIGELRAIHDAAKNDYDRMFLRANIAKLTGGISTIWVGGDSEIEIREKKARVEDAVEAVRSAIAEGIVPGGCAINFKLMYLLSKDRKRKESWSILEDALLAPLKLLLDNCGEEYDTVEPALRKKNYRCHGLPKTVFDAHNHKYVNPFAAGIIEPAKVARVALGNAISVATLLITLGGIVVVPRNIDLETQAAMVEKGFQNVMSQAGE